MVGGGVVIMLAMQGFGDGVGVSRFRKLLPLMGDEILRDESLDDDELTWMVLLKQHSLTLILVVLLIGLDDSDEVVDFFIARLW
jgi:hypothetical protein